jgi:competence protein ComEA
MAGIHDINFRGRLAALLRAAAISLSLAAPAWAAVEVNQASQAELESVKGIGPATSARLIEERKRSPFKDWDDLILRVKGVGAGSAAKLSEAGLTVNGAPLGRSATQAVAPKAAKPGRKASQ